jgi:hypothetical protein
MREVCVCQRESVYVCAFVMGGSLFLLQSERDHSFYTEQDAICQSNQLSRRKKSKCPKRKQKKAKKIIFRGKMNAISGAQR